MIQTYSVYLLPDDFRAQTKTPTNGRHGFFRSPDQLVEGRDPGWDDGKRISYGAHRYEEYTNEKTSYDDYYAFVRFSRPPRPGHSTLTIVWPRVELDQPAPEQLRQVARSATLL